MLPPNKHSGIIVHNTVEVLWYALTFYNGNRTFETKDQWKIKFGLGGLNYRVSENKGYLTTSIEFQEGHYVPQNAI